MPAPWALNDVLYLPALLSVTTMCPWSLAQATQAPSGLEQQLVARGHKAVSLALPLGKSTPLNPIDCSRRLFVDVHGQRIPRGHLNVEACVALPARRVALLGCEDGRVRVAA